MGSKSHSKIVGSYVSILEYPKMKIFPSNIVLTNVINQLSYRLVEDKCSNHYDDSYSDDLAIKIYLGSGDFYNIHIGSIIYAPYTANKTIKYPFQLPIILPNLGTCKLSLGAYPRKDILDAAFFAIELEIKNYYESHIYEYLNNEVKNIIAGKPYRLDEKFIFKTIINGFFIRYIVEPKEALRELQEKVVGKETSLKKIKDYIRRLIRRLDFSKTVDLLRREYYIRNRTLILNKIEKFLDYYFFEARKRYKNRALLMSIIWYALSNYLLYLKYKYGIEVDIKNLEVDQYFAINEDILTFILFVGLLELGVHGMSHLLGKILSTEFNYFTGRDAKELIVVTIPASDVLKDHLITFTNLYEGIMDGFLYRKVQSDSFYGLAIIYSNISHSGQYIRDVITKENLKQILKYDMKKLLVEEPQNQDICYKRYLRAHYPLRKNVYETIKNNILKINYRLEKCEQPVHEVLEHLYQVIKTTFGVYMEQKSFEEKMMCIEKSLYAPIEYLRRLIYVKVADMLADKYKKEKLLKDQCKREIRNNILKPYILLLYELVVPMCFDGCYNCILWENCGHPSPLSRHWLVSKYATKKLLGII